MMMKTVKEMTASIHMSRLDDISGAWLLFFLLMCTGDEIKAP